MGGNYLRAKKVVAQIHKGDWVGRYNPHSRSTLTIKNREGTEIWVGNTSFDCHVHNSDATNAFGFIYRHWVWWVAQGIRKESTKRGRQDEQAAIAKLFD